MGAEDHVHSATWYVTTTGNDTTSDLTWGGHVPTVPDSIPTAFMPNYVLTLGSEEPKKEENMRGFYRIIVVDPKTEGVFTEELVVAKDETQALLKAKLEPEVRANPDQYDFIIDRLGDVRAKKEIQKVKVVTEDEE